MSLVSRLTMILSDQKFDMGKVFGIGLQKTGTTSLMFALQKLGYKTKHFVPKLVCKNHSGGEIAPQGCEFHPEEVNIDIAHNYDALVDNPLPFPSVYKELAFAFPKAKFVLTTRPIDGWVQSVMSHIDQKYYKVILAERVKKYNNYDPYLDIVYSCDNMGVLEYLYKKPYAKIDKKSIEQCYKSHHKKVKKMFVKIGF